MIADKSFSIATLAVLLSTRTLLGISPPTIADFEAVRRPGTMWVDITYRLVSNDPTPVFVEAAADSGRHFDLPVVSVVGDVGIVAPGNGRIVWNAGHDAPGLWDEPWRLRLTIQIEASLRESTMVVIPGGSFSMGSNQGDPAETPVHSVDLPPYAIDRFETTNRAFMHFVQATGYRTVAEIEGISTVYLQGSYIQRWGACWLAPAGADSHIRGLLNHPVVQVTWDDARAYCAWAGKRLPSEAEWEKAAKGRGHRTYPWGEVAPNHSGIFRTNYGSDHCCQESAQDGYLNTAPVGTFLADRSPYGVYDMAGNVWEWTADWFDQDYYSISPNWEPVGPGEGTERVLRGGSWVSYPFNLRVTRRGFHTETTKHNYGGFRCATDIR